MAKKRIQVFLEDEEIAQLDEISSYMTNLKATAEKERGVPPSKRGRKVSRSKSGRQMILIGIEYMIARMHK